MVANDQKPSTNAEATIDAGIALAQLADRIHDFGDIPAVLVPNGMKLERLIDVVQLNDSRAEVPRRHRGTATLTEIASFIAHVNRHKDGSSVVFADTANVKLTAVLNYNQKGQDDPRWGDLRAVYACPLSDQWKLWTGRNGQKFKQEDFAQFIEDHMDDLASPTGSGADKDLPAPNEVLTMARNLTVRTKGEFSKTIDPVTGNFTLVNKNENETGSTKIPRAFLLQLPVFEAGAMYAVEARMRLEFQGAVPIFSYLLYRAEEIKRDAFNEVRTMVEQRTELPLFAGAPEQV